MKNLSGAGTDARPVAARIWRRLVLFGIFIFMLWAGDDALGLASGCAGAGTFVLNADLLIAAVAVPVAIAHFWRPACGIE